MKENKDIIEVYKKRVYNEKLIEKREKEEEILKADKFRKIEEDTTKKIKDVMIAEGLKSEAEHFVFSLGFITEDTKEKLRANDKAFEDAMDERNRIVEEVLAMKELCEDSESLTTMYKKYGILQDNGKIYDYRKEEQQ